MRIVLYLFLFFGALGCTPTGAERPGLDRSKVHRLNLRDPRLPIEARRWLADAEDEVAIARAHLDDAQARLDAHRAYRENVMARLEDAWAKAKDNPKATGEKAQQAFVTYADQRVKLFELELDLSKKALDLAIIRLTQARAETALRYDLAVYEMEPIIRKVELLRDEVAAIQRQVEEQRVNVETTADAVWKAFSDYVNKGGVTNAPWGTL